MNARARAARATNRKTTRNNRAHRTATRALTTGQPQSARTHLIARGLDPDLADRYASAFSRTAGPAAQMGTITKKLKKNSRRTRTFPVKLYTAAQIDAALMVYRPKTNPAAASAFNALGLAA